MVKAKTWLVRAEQMLLLSREAESAAQGGSASLELLNRVSVDLLDASRSAGTAAPVLIQTEQHELTLYADPGPFFEAVERAIASASKRVWLETYIYRNDELGAPFSRLLVSAAERGLDVRLLYDPQGSRGAPLAFFDSLAARGVSVRAYRRWRLARKRWAYWPRDHGRILLVDDTAHTGGINWGKEWLPRARGGDDWHDVSIGLRGPASADFATVFLQRWAEATERDEIADHLGEARSDVQLVADSPAHRSLILQRLCAAVLGAERRIWIENSYCVLPRVLLSALAAAAERGVDVQLLLPGVSDLPSIQAVSRGEYRRWLQSGISIFEYQERVMHSKFALVDDDWSTVGTFNAMSPGIWWANETNVIVQDLGFVSELALIFERDLEASSAITPAALARRPLRSRLWEGSAAILYRLVERVVLGALAAQR